MYFRGERLGKKKSIYRFLRIWFPRTPLNKLFDVYVKCRIYGSGYLTPRIFYFGGWINIFYGFGFSRTPGNFYIFFEEYRLLKNAFQGGWVAEKYIILGKWNLQILLRQLLVPPCNAYILEYLKSNIFKLFYGSRARWLLLAKNGLQWSSAQNILEYFQVTLGIFRFPCEFQQIFQEKKINWIEVQNPLCLYIFRKIYVVIGCYQWYPTSIFFQI